MNTSNTPLVHNTLAFILAGGVGERLGALTARRPKPVLPFAGHYRLIDFSLSNCASTDIRTVGVLTQYRPHALNLHIGDGAPWGFGRGQRRLMLLHPYHSTSPVEANGFWFKGTADAVRQYRFLIEEERPAAVLILSADHVYTMDYGPLLQHHLTSGADITIATTLVPRADAPRFGIVETHDGWHVSGFLEKVEDPPSCVASMGVYVFRTEALLEELRDGSESVLDFGHDLLPRALRANRDLRAYRYDGYWRDVGTVEAYWAANMDLLKFPSSLQLDAPNREVRTRMPDLPPASIGPDAQVRESLLSPGTHIEGTVERSIISPGVIVDAGAEVRDSILLNGCHIQEGTRVECAVVEEGLLVSADAARDEAEASANAGGPIAGHNRVRVLARHPDRQ